MRNNADTAAAVWQACGESTTERTDRLPGASWPAANAPMSLSISELQPVLEYPELAADGLVAGTYGVECVHTGRASTGEYYLRLRLYDVTGAAHVYSRYADWPSPPRDGQAHTVGFRWVHDRYENLVPLARPFPATQTLPERSPLELLPGDRLPEPENLFRLLTLVESLRTPGYRALVEEVFRDRELAYLFATLPASRRCHHTGEGGLLAHSLDVAEGVRRATGHLAIGRLRREALILVGLLHDIGKALLNTREGYRLPSSRGEHAALIDYALATPMARLKARDLDAFTALWQVIDGYKRKDRYTAPLAALVESMDSVSAQTNLIQQRSASHPGYRLPGCHRETVWHAPGR
ncbi:MAG: TraI domain-containing protein [Arhodomonas sp.]|nr:TraI domain-containing protein [Arhodomonas sp.]